MNRYREIIPEFFFTYSSDFMRYLIVLSIFSLVGFGTASAISECRVCGNDKETLHPFVREWKFGLHTSSGALLSNEQQGKESG